MALSTGSHSGCYCCKAVGTRMDIDAALDELGMLSTVTESRKQYLQERMRTRSESAILSKRESQTKSHTLPVRESQTKSHSLPVSTASSSNFHIVHLDTKYITAFGSPLTNSESSSELAEDLNPSKCVSDEVFLDHCKEYRIPPDNLDSSATYNRKMRLLKNKQECILARNRRIMARKRAKKPYEVPWRLSQSFQESVLDRHCDIPESKSNSSSPVKPVNSESLTRSRSLDNIDFSSFLISESHDRQDIDNVASGIKNLNVSDS